VNTLDYIVLFGTLLGVAIYGVWRTRGRRDLSGYLKGDGQARWFIIGLSVIATQASATTFLSIPGQGYQDGLGFVQNYFGGPFAMILIAAVFLPIFRRLKVFTAYEFLGQRFDSKTRLLGAALFLTQRGIGAALTIYAPAIVLSAVFGWPLNWTILCSGLVCVVYTVTGGSDAVRLTQKYQLGIICAAMVAAFFLLLAKMPTGFGDTLALAGGFHKLAAVDFSPNLHTRYTFWSGTIGGFFLALAYFGADQSQVQRYIGGASLRDGRLGLMFHAVCKIPMQFFILLLGVLLFVFYQFAPSPLLYARQSREFLTQNAPAEKLRPIETEFANARNAEGQQLQAWLAARRAGDAAAAQAALTAAQTANAQSADARQRASDLLEGLHPPIKANEADYVFITFILNYLPHGLIGLLVAAFFAAALSSKAAELNALASATTVDFYRHLWRRDATQAHYVFASKCFTAFWGLFAIIAAIYANLVENIVQAANIIGSLFYGPVLGLFLMAFFIPRVRGTAAFWGALAAQTLVLALYHYDVLGISYLWFNVLGPALCVLFSLVIQAAIGFAPPTPAAPAAP
jgi:solute:Na+ symporter, SSS family